MSNISSKKDTDVLLSALGEQLAADRERFELVVVGGSGLPAIGAIERATRDVDLVALRGEDGLDSPDPLPAALSAARDRVALDFSLPPDWLNAGPAGLLDLGLPTGFDERLVCRDYGPGLAVYFASRLDQIHFKLYAWLTRDRESTRKTCGHSRRPRTSWRRRRDGLALKIPRRDSSRFCGRSSLT